MARVCPSCGHENADDVDFCASCGGYVRWEPTRATPAVQPPSAAAPPPAAPAPAPAEPAQAAPPAAPPPQAPVPAQQAAPQPPPAPAQPAQPAQTPPAPPAQAPPPAQPQQPAQAQPAQPAAPPAEPQPEEPKQRRWGRKKKIPGVQGGGISKPRVAGPRVAAPRINVGPGGVNVSAPRVSGPRVAPPVARAPRLKQPKIPRTPKDLMKAFKKLPGGGGGKGGGDSGVVEGAPVAPQPVETWHWDAVGHESGRGKKGIVVLLLLLLLAGAGAAAGWWFFVREDDEASAAPKAAAATPKTFVTGLEPLLVRSSRDRVRISRAVTGVAACSLAPDAAAKQIDQTIAGRNAVLRQVRRVQPPNAQIRRVRGMLERSLSFSAAAGRDYSLWIASFNGACPVRAGPEYAKALATNRKAQASKVAFSRAYNPIARRVGGRTWQSTEF